MPLLGIKEYYLLIIKNLDGCLYVMQNNCIIAKRNLNNHINEKD